MTTTTYLKAGYRILRDISITETAEDIADCLDQFVKTFELTDSLLSDNLYALSEQVLDGSASVDEIGDVATELITDYLEEEADRERFYAEAFAIEIT